MSLSFNITNPGLNFDGILTSVESQYVTDLVLAGGTASENEVLTWKSGAPSWEAAASGFADPLTTNGDIIARVGGVTTRLAQGANGSYLGVSGGALGYYTPGGAGDVVGPAGATDNAIVRFDTTTGKLIQNSIVTIGDTGAIANTIANTSNVVGLTITQNDTTNNPKAVSVVNAGAGNSIYIDANGNTGTLASTSGALFLDNTNNTGTGANFYTNGATVGSTGVLFAKVDNASATGPVARFDNDGTGPALKVNANGNTGTSTTSSGAILIDNTNNIGYGFNVYTNAGASAGALAVLHAANAAFDQTALQIYQYGTSGAAAAIRIDGVSPQIEMVETDQTTPAGKYELQVQGDRFFINGRNSGDTAFENAVIFDRLGNSNAGRTSFVGPICPITTDTAAIGSTSLQWSDLYLAEGGVINWDNGDVTLTQSGNTLNVAGGGFTVSQAGTPATFTNTTDSASVQGLIVQGDRATPAAFDEVYQSFNLSDSVGNQDEAVRLQTIWADATSTSEDSVFGIYTRNAGTLARRMIVDFDGVRPGTTDQGALGGTSSQWSDLFLAEGGVINWDNGDATLTQTGNVVKLAGASLETDSAIELGHASDTTVSRVSAGVIAVEGIPVVIANSSNVGYVPTITGANTYTWQAASGGGNVSKVGTPVNNQVGVWTGDGTIEGDAMLTWDGAADTLSINASTANYPLVVERLSDSTAGPFIKTKQITASPAAGDYIGGVDLYSSDSAANEQAYAYFNAKIVSPTSGAEYGSFVIETIRNGVLGTSGKQMLEVGAESDSAINGISVGFDDAAGIVSSRGNNDLTLQTGNTTTGNITITDGANGNISLTPNGTGAVAVSTTIELGHASDTTISRVSAGVIAVEGVTVPTISSTNTLTNKRVNPRTASSTTSATLTPDLSSANVYFRTTQTEALTIGAPTGTPVIGETIMIYVDSAGAQTLTMNATYKVFGAAFPATTTAGKTLMLSCQYNGTDWKTLWAVAV